MCGFAGVINHKDKITVNNLEKIACDVSFRGPDSTDFRILDENMNHADAGNSGVFFNRLAIIDLNSRSNQPFERGDNLLIFNGEIYNYKELKSELGMEGVVFETTSDTEVLFYVLKNWGVNGITRLNGMFAFFWLDRKNKSFLIARDQIGIKPLYYSQKDRSFYFSSELSSIVKLWSSTPEIDMDALKMYLWMKYVPTPHSIIKGIKKLEPGHYLQGTLSQLNSLDTLKPKCFWNAYQVALDSKGTSNPVDLESLLVDSLKRQLNSDVPLGLFLSSGVDSSLLAALVNKYFARDRKFSFFTVAFHEKTPMDESQEAKEFIKGFNNNNLVWESLNVDPEYIGKHLDDLYKYYDEPFADYSSLMTWVVSRKAREHVTVAISGDGADELFWGYPRYNKWENIGSYHKPLITPLMKAVNRMLPDSQFKYNAIFALDDDPIRRHFDMFLSSGLRFLIKDHIAEKKIWATQGIKELADLKGLPAILDLKTYLPDTMLYKVDRSSMAASLEVRVPFLDNEIISFALNLDFQHKSDNRFQNKAILKDLLLKLAPHFDPYREKRGFTFPMHEWLRSNWKERVLSNVTKKNLEAIGLEAGPYLRIVENFYKNNSKHFTDVWAIYSLIHWHQTFTGKLR